MMEFWLGVLLLKVKKLLNRILPSRSKCPYTLAKVQSVANPRPPYSEEQAKVKNGKKLMPWVKLSIHQVEFLAKEFGGDTESVQKGLAPATREYFICRCAEIVHDENHYEETNDSRFNYARKYMAKLILESYGRTEDGWKNEHREEIYMFDPRKVKRCAYCKSWEGDAQLRKGNSNGTVSFKDGVYGKCLKTVPPRQAASNGGGTCQNYAISVDADRFI